MADEITPIERPIESKSANVNASLSSSTEYTDVNGKKVIVSEAELNPDNLKTTSIQRVEAISELPDLKLKPLCINCRFWNVTEVRQNKEGKPFPINGECRVNAPEIIAATYNQCGFPLISPFQWCGKYEKIT